MSDIKHLPGLLNKRKVLQFCNRIHRITCKVSIILQNNYYLKVRKRLTFDPIGNVSLLWFPIIYKALLPSGPLSFSD